VAREVDLCAIVIVLIVLVLETALVILPSPCPHQPAWGFVGLCGVSWAFYGLPFVTGGVVGVKQTDPNDTSRLGPVSVISHRLSSILDIVRLR
jgi:hypothetical protein